MPYSLWSLPQLEHDLLTLSPKDRDEFWQVVHRLQRDPFVPGLGYQVVKVRDKNPLLSDAWTAHFSRNRLRLLFFVDGAKIILVGVGPRPGFYRKLNRLRSGRLR